jgi:hypothetical protein
VGIIFGGYEKTLAGVWKLIVIASSKGANTINETIINMISVKIVSNLFLVLIYINNTPYL